jgi:hypothetical protein
VLVKQRLPLELAAGAPELREQTVARRACVPRVRLWCSKQGKLRIVALVGVRPTTAVDHTNTATTCSGEGNENSKRARADQQFVSGSNDRAVKSVVERPRKRV